MISDLLRTKGVGVEDTAVRHGVEGLSPVGAE